MGIGDLLWDLVDCTWRGMIAIIVLIEGGQKINHLVNLLCCCLDPCSRQYNMTKVHKTYTVTIIMVLAWAWRFMGGTPIDLRDLMMGGLDLAIDMWEHSYRIIITEEVYAAVILKIYSDVGCDLSHRQRFLMFQMSHDLDVLKKQGTYKAFWLRFEV